MTNLSRVEDILREGADYSGPLLSRVEVLLFMLVKNQGKIGFRGPYDSLEDLPIPGVEGYIYLVENTDPESEDNYNEYYWNDEDETYYFMGSAELKLDIDDTFSIASENPLQNKVITHKFSQVDDAISTETSARQLLAQQLSRAISQLDYDVSTETSMRQSNDARLERLISQLDSDISTETSARQANDQRLSQLISALDTEIDDHAQALVQIQSSLQDKVDKIQGKGLSKNDFTDAYKGQLDNLDLTPYQTKTLSNPITVDGVQQTTTEGALNAINNKTVDVDNALSSVSENPVQNKVVKGALDEKQDYVGLSIVNGRLCVTYEEEV